MNSIRRQLTLSLLIGSVVVLGVAGVILHGSVGDALVDQFDVGMHARARALGALVEREGIYVEFNYSEETLPEYAGGDDPSYFTLWLADLPDAMTSPTLAGVAFERHSGPTDAPAFWDLDLPDGRPGRAIGIDLPVVLEDDDDDDDEDGEGALLDSATAAQADLHVTVLVAASREKLDEQLAALGGGLLFAGATALLLLLLGVTLAVRRGLKPIDRLAKAVAAVDATSLSTRVGSDGVPEELRAFTVTLDELFERLEASFAKERRMTAAMAHELRTPIAELRTASDVARTWPDDDAMVDEVVATAGDVAQRMGDSIESLMRYCRLEAGQARPEIEDVALHALLDECWKPYAELADERGVRFLNEVGADAVVASDRGLLGVVFGNLLHNAASFASGGVIVAAVDQEHRSVTVVVANHSDDLEAGDLEHISEPFWRKDHARSDGRHSGLGLTLVSSIAAVLGHRASFKLEDGCFSVSIRFDPAAPAVPEPSENGHSRQLSARP